MVSVYAFSIENFKRDPDEVEKLMNLAKTKFEEFATKRLPNFCYFLISFLF